MSGRKLLVTGLVLTISLPASAAVAASHDIELTEPDPGEHVRGTTTLRARATGDVSSVRFEWSTSGGEPWHAIGVATQEPSNPNLWSRSWDSEGVDGPGFIRAIADDGATEVDDIVEVVFDNRPSVDVEVAPSPFSPNGDGRRDRTSIRVLSDEPGEVTIEAIDVEDQVRRQWRRDTDGSIAVRWNGRAEGRRLPDGRYLIDAAVTDAAGLTGSATARMRIDTRRPSLAWLSVAPEPLENQDDVRFRFAVTDIGRIRMRLDISDRTDRLTRRRVTVRSGDRTIHWVPRYADGGRLFPGQYGAGLLATDEAGNRRRSRLMPWRVHREVPAHVYTRLPDAGRRVALTFDDCFREGAWRSILGKLRTAQVDATFFCTGGAATRAKPLMRRTVREGHVFASHTWDHAELPGHRPSYTSSRIARDEALSWRVARYTTAPYFRPPFGALDSDVVAGAREAAHPRIIMWDVDPRDWTFPGVHTIVRRSVGEARAGSIILLHTLPATSRAVPSIIAGLRDKGLRPVTIAELFEAAGYRPG